ncbi:MAG: hypothetical protein Pars2KO_16940 [Parasphingorhabdus sp.]
MKKMLILPAVLLMVSCGGNDEVASGTFDDGEGNEGSYSLSGDDENAEVTIKSGDGEVKFTTGNKASEDLPMGVKLYPGADVQTSIKGMGDGQSGAMVVFKSDDGQEKVLDFYKDQMKSIGIDVRTEINTGDMKMIGGEQKDGQVFNVSVTKDPGGGVVTNLLIGGK